MKLLKAALAVTGLIACSSMSAYADTVYDWTLTGAGLDGTGTVSLGASASGGYGTGNLADSASGSILIDINGTTSDQTITGVAPLASFGFSKNNNIVYPSAAAAAAGENVDGDGLGLSLSNGDTLTIWNNYGQSFDEVTLYNASGAQAGYSDNSFAVTATAPVPLPPTGTMMILGLLGLGLFAARGAGKGPDSTAAAA